MSIQANSLETSEAQSFARRWWVLAVMSVGVLMVFIDNTVVNTALPAISLDLEASNSALQWIVDSYVLILAGLLLLGGSLGDRYGRKRWMTIGLGLFGLAAVGAALADSTEMLIAMRAAQGLGAALVLPATLSIITNTFPRKERAKAIAIWTAVGALGIGVGPVLGGYLVDNISWSAVFWLHIPIVAAAMIGMVIVPESRDERGLKLDIPGAILGTTGLIALVFGIIRGGEAGWTSGGVLAAFGVGGCSPDRFRQSRDALGFADAAPQVLPPEGFHWSGDCHRSDAVRHAGVILFPDTVLPDRPGPKRLCRGLAHRADLGGDDVLGPALREADGIDRSTQAGACHVGGDGHRDQ